MDVAADYSSRSETSKMAGKPTPIQVHQLAESLGVSSERVIDWCELAHIPEISDHMSEVSPDHEGTIREWLGGYKESRVDQLAERLGVSSQKIIDWCTDNVRFECPVKGTLEITNDSYIPSFLVPRMQECFRNNDVLRVWQMAKRLRVSSEDIIIWCQVEGIPEIIDDMSEVSQDHESCIREWFSGNNGYRVDQLADRLGFSSQDIIDWCKSIEGIPGFSSWSRVPLSHIPSMRRWLSGDKVFRVYQLAGSLGVSSEEIIMWCQVQGIPQVEGVSMITDDMSEVPLYLVEPIRQWFSCDSEDKEEPRLVSLEALDTMRDVIKAHRYGSRALDLPHLSHLDRVYLFVYELLCSAVRHRGADAIPPWLGIDADRILRSSRDADAAEPATSRHETDLGIPMPTIKSVGTQSAQVAPPRPDAASNPPGASDTGRVETSHPPPSSEASTTATKPAGEVWREAKALMEGMRRKKTLPDKVRAAHRQLKANGFNWSYGTVLTAARRSSLLADHFNVERDRAYRGKNARRKELEADPRLKYAFQNCRTEAERESVFADLLNETPEKVDGILETLSTNSEAGQTAVYQLRENSDQAAD